MKTYHLMNKKTNWWRHANGGRDTSDARQAVSLSEDEAREWFPIFRKDYDFISYEIKDKSTLKNI